MTKSTGAPRSRRPELGDNDLMPFGKHKGERMQFVPMNYLNWFLQQEWANSWPNVVQYAKRAQRGAEQDQERKERQ